MAEPAISKMTVTEFLRWEDGTDTRYELLDGIPVAMAPPAVAPGFLAARLCARIETSLRSRPPCMVQIEAGIARPDRDDTCYVADLAVTCTPPQPGQTLLADPVLMVETCHRAPHFMIARPRSPIIAAFRVYGKSCSSIPPASSPKSCAGPESSG